MKKCSGDDAQKWQPIFHDKKIRIQSMKETIKFLYAATSSDGVEVKAGSTSDASRLLAWEPEFRQLTMSLYNVITKSDCVLKDGSPTVFTDTRKVPNDGSSEKS